MSSDNTAANAAKSSQLDKVEKSEVVQLVDRLIITKRICYQQYQELSNKVLEDGTVDEQERRQINRLFDAIQSGSVRIID